MKLPKIVSQGPFAALLGLLLSTAVLAQNSDADYWNNLADGNIVPSVPQVIADTTPSPVVDVAPQPLQETQPPPVVEEAPQVVVDSTSPPVVESASPLLLESAESVVSSMKPLTTADTVAEPTEPTLQAAQPMPVPPAKANRKKAVADPFLVQAGNPRKYGIDPGQELRFQGGRNLVYRGGWMAVGGLALHLAGYAGDASAVVVAGATISTVGVLISGIGYGRMTDSYNTMYPEDKRRRGGWGWFWTGAIGVALADLMYVSVSNEQNDEYSYSSDTYEDNRKQDQFAAAFVSSISEVLVMAAWLQFVSGSSKLNKAFKDNNVQVLPVLTPERQGLQATGSF